MLNGRHLLVATIAMFAGVASATPYEDILDEMTAIQADNAEFVSWIDLGVNDQGKMIRGLRIDGPGDEDHPNHLVVGVHHGNEQLSADVAMEFIRQSVELIRYPALPGSSTVRNKTFHVVPVLNIGGYDRGRREEYDADGRSHDPNRDYPDPCRSSGETFKLQSTSALAAYLESQNIIGAVTIHGYIGTFTFPWGTYTTQTRTPDHQKFVEMTENAASINGYRVGTHADVIYPTVGAFEDWAYYEHGVWVTLQELRRNADIEEDATSLLAYFDELPGVRSEYHDHTGTCRGFDFKNVRARP